MTIPNNIPQGYKMTSLGIIPQEWEVKRLGNICSHFKSGESITSKDISENGKYPVYGGNGLRGYSAKYTHDGSYILIGRQGALCGNINYVEGKSYISEHAIAVQTTEDLSWLRYKLDFWNLNRYSESSAQPGLSVAKLIRYKLSVPPLAEQQKIAEVLGTWDKAIEKQTQLIKKLELRKKGLMQQLLTGKKRMLGFFGPWKKVRLKEIFIEGSKIPVDSTSRYKKISIGLYKKGISYVDDNKVKADIRPFYVREKGEIIIGKQNYFNGSIAIVNDKFDGTICSNAIMSFRVKNLFNLKFIYEAISQPDYLKKREMMANGTGQKELSEKDFLNFDIVVPSFEEQIAIAQILTAADREIELEQQKLELLRQQKRGLMQQLLTGKKRVKI